MNRKHTSLNKDCKSRVKYNKHKQFHKNSGLNHSPMGRIYPEKYPLYTHPYMLLCHVLCLKNRKSNVTIDKAVKYLSSTGQFMHNYHAWQITTVISHHLQSVCGSLMKLVVNLALKLGLQSRAEIRLPGAFYNVSRISLSFRNQQLQFERLTVSYN